MTEKKERALLIVSKRGEFNITQELTKLAFTETSVSRIFVACPTPCLEATRDWVQSIKAAQGSCSPTFEVVPFDPYGDRKACFSACEKLVSAVANYTIDVFFNLQGAIPNRFGVVLEESGMLEMAQVKVMSILFLIEMLIKEGSLSDGSRVVVSGSEAAKGIPEMKIDEPIFGDTLDSFISILDGSALDKNISMVVYAHVQGVLSLMIGSFARKHPKIYFCVLSPGFTQDSLNRNIQPEPTGIIGSYFFSFLQYFIGQDYKIAASNFFNAVTDKDWDYPSGSLVGCAKGVKGEICDQSTLPGGSYLSDSSKQDHAYDALKNFAVF